MLSFDKGEVKISNMELAKKPATVDFITIDVQYYGAFRDIAKKAEEQLELHSTSLISDLLGALARTYGSAFSAEIFEGGEAKLREDFILTINGAIVDRATLGSFELSAGDTVALLPIFPGGG